MPEREVKKLEDILTLEVLHVLALLGHTVQVFSTFSVADNYDADMQVSRFEPTRYAFDRGRYMKAPT